MNWFGYVWLGPIPILYIIWTVKAIKDFIDSVSYAKRRKIPLRELFEINRGWGLWLVIHFAILIINSFLYCVLYNALR